MARVSSWLLLVRCFQLLGTLPIAVMNGYLAVRMSRRMGESSRFQALELLVVAILVHTIVAISVQHGGKRLQSASWLSAFVVLDFISCGLALAVIVLLAQAGLPLHCGGLTGPFPEHADPEAETTREHHRRRHTPGQDSYSATGFSYPGAPRGRLDSFCGAERSYLFVATLLVYSYMATVLLGVLLKKQLYTKSTTRLGTYAHAHALDLEHGKASEKMLGDSSPLPLLSTPAMARAAVPAPPLSEGVMSRNTSVRSAVPPRLREEYTGDAALVSDGMRPGGMLPRYEPTAAGMPGHALESNDVRLSDYVKGATSAQDKKDSGRF